MINFDVLAWYASQEVTSIWADIVTLGLDQRSWQALGFDFDWDLGFRVGFGHNLKYDDWDTNISWTWFKTENVHHIRPVNSPTSISPEFDAALLSGDSPQSMRAKWRLLFDTLDWELGKKYSLSNDLFFRFFVGIKSGFINQDISA